MNYNRRTRKSQALSTRKKLKVSNSVDSFLSVTALSTKFHFGFDAINKVHETMDSAASDPFLLDWGSSLNVNEDLRRTIQSEITAIEKDIRSLDDSIRKEEKVSAQSRRDFSYAQAELIQLNRGAGDEEDNAAMNEQIQMRLSDTLAKEIIAVISPVESEENKALQDTDGADTRTCSSGVDTLDTGMADIAKRAHDVRNLKHAIQAKNESFDDCKSKATEMKYLLNNSAARLVREQKNQATWNDDLEVKRRENDSEKQRFRCAKDSLYRARKYTGEYTQQRTNYLNELGSDQRMHENEEEKLKLVLETNESAISELSDKVSIVSRSVAAKSDRLDCLREQQAEREIILSQRQVVQKERQGAKARLQSLSGRDEEIVNVLDQGDKELDLSKDNLMIVQKHKADLDQVLASGQKEEAEVLEPARIELPKLLKESEELARLIASYRENLSSLKKSGESNLSLTRGVLDDVKNQVKDKSDDEKEKVESLSTLQETWQYTKKLALDDIEQHNNLGCKFEAARNAEAVVIQALQEQRAKERCEKNEAKRHESLAEVLKRELLSCGADIIKKTERSENEFESLAIEA